MTIGQRIKSAREARGMTQDEIAKLCKTTKQTIFKYENDIVTNIPYGKIELLISALSVTPSYLFGWEEKKPAPSEPQLTEGEFVLLELFRKIPADKQAMVIQMIRVALETQ